MYQLNKENPIVKMLLEIDKKLMLESIEEGRKVKMMVLIFVLVFQATLRISRSISHKSSLSV